MKDTNLLTIANYARVKKCSTTWVYKLAEQGKIKIKKIDGIKFVITK